MSETNIDWKEKAAQYSSMCARNAEQIDSLEAEIEQLRTLAKFAWHTDDCGLYGDTAKRPRTCSCGYTDAQLAVNSSVIERSGEVPK